ncbi:MAG: hypothetical protein WBA93_04510 [Microcoleaceae cyanobacterium]
MNKIRESTDREQKQRQHRQQLTIFALLTALVIVSGSEIQRRRAIIGKKNAEIGVEIVALELRFDGNLDTQLDLIKHGKELKKLQDRGQIKPDIPFLTAGISAKMTDWRESNRLEAHQDEVFSAEFSPNGDLIATASADKTVKIWNFNIDDLLKHSCDWVRDYLKNHLNVTEKDRRICDDID